jgi:NAD(P)-dependent dehydrogenase (short-subunit alcohol dehydrogenase family)
MVRVPWRGKDRFGIVEMRTWTITADVGKPAECEEACKSVLDQHGPIDILINNVGGRRENIPTESMTLEKWREHAARAVRSAPTGTAGPQPSNRDFVHRRPKMDGLFQQIVL